MNSNLANTNYFSVIALTACGCLSWLPVASADWPGFLGPGGNPVTDQSLPIDFSAPSDTSPGQNVAWRVPLDGRAVSGPIVVDGKVITTSSASMEGRWMYVSAVDAKTGELLWQRSTKSTGRPFCHPSSANAAPTPCSDGEKVFAFFSSNDIVCYDLDGNLQWFKSLTQAHPLAGNDVGMSSSPVVQDGVVVVTVECQADSFTAGLDTQTGETLWELSRPESANWASPRIATDSQGASALLLQGRNELQAVGLKSGKKLWGLDVSCSSVATAVAAKGQIFVPANGVQVFELESVQEKPALLWETTRISPSSASLLVTDFGLIGLNRSVLVCCGNDGERAWNTRLKDAGQIWATPVIAGDYMYAFAMNGKCFTIKVSQESAEVVSESELGSEVLGSPAIDENALYVRSVDALWKIATSK